MSKITFYKAIVTKQDNTTATVSGTFVEDPDDDKTDFEPDYLLKCHILRKHFKPNEAVGTINVQLIEKYNKSLAPKIGTSEKVHAEIEYFNSEGMAIHSDICPPDHLAANLQSQEYREFLHACLDEWLDKSRGTGVFYIANEDSVY